ncbi:MAG: proliferating cell nuclear antigen (pcna) [Candidatus Nitrosoabyssus spongiisocia]|nr:MAG: proliferating cell nuclear antigen (pcna) [Nitrosopumilaceae archaeon AB1(1)]
MTNGSDDLKAIISAISTLMEEATFVATEEGITFRGMDPSHVALIDILWPNSAFENYECDDKIEFGVNIVDFSKLIRRADKKDAIKINVTDDNNLQVVIGKNKNYKIRLLESSSTDTPLPKVPYNSKFTIESASFNRVLGDIQVVSDYLTITTKTNGVIFSGSGDSGDAHVDFKKNNDELIELQVDEEGTGTYSLDYLNPVVKAVGNTTGSIMCEFSSSKPLRLEFKVANVGRIHFYLAPRVEN